MVLTKEEFKDLIVSHINWDKKVDEISDVLGCDFFESNLINYPQELFDKVLKHIFIDEGVDTIYWWMYDYEDKNTEAMWDENGIVIPMKTLDDLWNYVKNFVRDSEES